MVKGVIEQMPVSSLSRLTRREFDAARAAAGYPACPAGSALCRRFALGWRDLLLTAVRDRSFHSNAARHRALAVYEGGITDDLTRTAALAFIAAKRGTRTLLPDEYQQERAKLLAGTRGQRRVALSGRFPTYGQFAARPWDQWLAAAGLEARPATPKSCLPPASPLTDIITWFLCAQGYLPAAGDLRRFRDDYHVALPGHLTKARLAATFSEIRTKRTAVGRFTPLLMLSGTARPPWATPDQQPEPVVPHDAIPARHQRQGTTRRWTLDQVKAGLALALKHLSPGQTLNQPTLRQLAKQHRQIPAPSVVGRIAAKHHTTFRELRDQAARSLVSGQPLS